MDVDAALMVSVLTLDAESQPADALDEIHDILEDVLPDSLDDFDDADTQQDGNDVVEEVQPDAVDLRAVLERAASTSQAHADSWASGAWTSAASSPELQAAFEQLIQRVAPGPVDHVRRTETMQLLTVSVERRFKGVSVALFGSQVSGFNLKGSDLDVTLQLAPESEYRHTDPDKQHKQKQRLLRQLLYGVLERHRAVANTLLIPFARVPVLKFETVSGLRGDISVESDGVFKSGVLAALADLQPLYRSLVRIVKVWARVHGFNDAAEGTLNSFAWSLLALFHCQCGLPRPLLPPVAYVLCDYPDAVLQEERARAQACATRPGPTRLEVDASRDVDAVQRRCAALRAQRFGDDMATSLTLPSLTASFFAHLADMLPLLQDGACPQPFSAIWGVPGPWAKRRRLGFCIEDPFDAEENPARSTEHDIVFGPMAQCVRATAAALASPPPPQDVDALRRLALTVFGDARMFDAYNPAVEDFGLMSPLLSPGRGARCTPGTGRGRGQPRGGRGGGRGPRTPRSSPAPSPAAADDAGASVTQPRALPKPRVPAPRPPGVVCAEALAPASPASQYDAGLGASAASPGAEVTPSAGGDGTPGGGPQSAGRRRGGKPFWRKHAGRGGGINTQGTV